MHVTGTPQVPASGVASVLLHLTVTPEPAPGHCGSRGRDDAPEQPGHGVRRQHATHRDGAGAGERHRRDHVRDVGAGVTVAVDAIGYLTIG